jgi:hypothetical protein
MSPGLTEAGNIKAVELGQPSWLVGVNRGGSLTLPASIKHLGAHFRNVWDKFLCSSEYGL